MSILPKDSKYYIISFSLIIIGILAVTFIPKIINQTTSMVSAQSFSGSEVQIPSNNAAVAGIQNYKYPPLSKNIPPPPLSAKAVLVKDLDTGEILYQKNNHSRIPIASTTKIMTALVASEYFAQNAPLTVRQGGNISGSRVGLVNGESLSFRSLLYGMLLNSGNDAAFAIAENYPGGVANFVANMNKKAEALGATNTHFDNPAGFDSPNHFSSASDLALITEEALKSEILARIFSTKDTEVTSLDKTKKYKLHNLNKLLSSVSGVLGVKTGYTDLAKENLVGLVERDGHKILTVVLGSDDRFGESTTLIEWTFQNFSWR